MVERSAAEVTPDTQAAETRTPEEKVRYWLEQIRAARKREKMWRREARSCLELYEADKKKDYQYNILYSNTETMAPALYNATPRPVVVRRFRDADPIGKSASEVTRRTLEYLADTNEQDYLSFDDLMSEAVLSALVPGRGITRFKYEAELAEGKPTSSSTITERSEGVELDQGVQNDAPEVSYETICGESVPYDRFLHGYAKSWNQVPWVAYDHYMDREELIANFGKELGALIPLTESEKEAEDGPSHDKWSRKPDSEANLKLALVHEIWNKVDRTVLFICPAYATEPLRVVPDPLKLTGFFPQPKPLMFMKKIKTLVPTTLYAQYEEQAKELNRLTVRINRIINACKVRGMYDKRVEGIERLLQQDDNTLLPVENMSQIGDMANLETAIWLMPIDKLAGVLTVLYNQRQQIKSVIYEITGISDILRGASVASETAAAQELKAQWGSLRIKRLQKDVQRYARDCFRIMAEIAMQHLSQKTIQQMTGLQYPTMAMKMQAQSLLAQAQQSIPPGAQPPPQLQQVLGQAQQVLQQPAWEEILGMLKSQLARSYRVDIETNSTIDPEATEDQQQIAELLNAISQFFNGAAPMVQSGVMPFEAIQAILMVVVRRYRFGPEIEDYLKGMKPPQPQQDPKGQIDLQIAQMQLQGAQQEAQLKQQELQQKAEYAQMQHQMKMQELQLKAAEKGIVLQQSKTAALHGAIDLAQAQETTKHLALKNEGKRIDANAPVSA